MTTMTDELQNGNDDNPLITLKQWGKKRELSEQEALKALRAAKYLVTSLGGIKMVRVKDAEKALDAADKAQKARAMRKALKASERKREEWQGKDLREKKDLLNQNLLEEIPSLSQESQTLNNQDDSNLLAEPPY
jgi:hypothetical protein